jgi:hypothetical protein
MLYQTDLTSPGRAIDMASITSALENKRFRFSSEVDLQEGIEIALLQACLPFEREKVLSSRDRPDFVVDQQFAIEIKIQGTLSQALRQINRYAEHAKIKAILVVGTPHWVHHIPDVVGGKPVFAMRLTGSLL